ncbi:MAG: hypothetical protein K6T81_12505 [Alicyclobacillus macrosporangiidus]|uniref:hypothetical protein n=1 Tax=Alicyclobacillus macrosporangiidus TaxID=392015 RepID=UPI0026ED7FE7|nr:hypothetical protein [Alicyclobacillus macrosporangiidus]MCL6599545.1 hypothetical protein [Alicyclobacillus macrosporangiidus]
MDEKFLKRVLTEPKPIGCPCCSREPHIILPKDTVCNVGFGVVTLRIDGEMVWMSDIDTETNVAWLENEFRYKLDKCAVATLQFDTPLHDETYEWDKNSRQWYLVHQGEGFA